MAQDVQVLRPGVAMRVVYVALFVAGLVGLYLRIGEPLRDWVLLLFGLAGAVCLLDLFISRIVLSADGIRIVSIAGFQSRTIRRADVERVTWEKGCGASIRLSDGTWVRLPSVGRDAQGLTNTIRAWLKRTAAEGSSSDHELSVGG